jgi:hypothetical protein
MTGIPELMLGLGIIGGTTAVIVVLAVILGRKEEPCTTVRTEAVASDAIRRAS